MKRGKSGAVGPGKGGIRDGAGIGHRVPKQVMHRGGGRRGRR